MSPIYPRSDHNSARARIAVSAIFATIGLVLGSWAAHLPGVKHAVGASSSAMGFLLLVLGVGALLGMQAGGYAVDRFGAERLAVVGASAMGLALIPPLIVSTWLAVVIAAVLLGLAVGIAEVGVNAAAVTVEREYQRPIMASFHGMFSVGTVIGALLVATALARDISVEITAMSTTSLALVFCVIAAQTLLRRPTAKVSGPLVGSIPHSVDRSAPKQRRRLVMLGALAFLLLLAEGSAMDWSSLHSQQHLGATPSSGALALASFVSAMMVGRFTADRVVARIGPVQVLRWGCVVAVSGLVIVTQSVLLPITCMGWILLGLGLSGTVPQVFTASGNLPGASAKALSRVVGAGYLAVLAGPAVVGWLADMIGLNGALILPTVAVLICACAANAVEAPKATS